MSQDLYFYRQKIIAEELAQILSKEKVEETIKSLLKKQDLEVNVQLREKLFEEVESSIEISANTKGIEELLVDKIEYIPPDSRRFMINEKIWLVIQEVILDEYNNNKEIENSKKTNTTNKSEIDPIDQLLQSKSFQLLKDYSILDELFKKNCLFINIQWNSANTCLCLDPSEKHLHPYSTAQSDHTNPFPLQDVQSSLI